MGWGKRAFDQDRVRESLMTQAAVDLTGNLGRADEKTYLVAIFAELVRLNDNLERQASESAAAPSR